MDIESVKFILDNINKQYSEMKRELKDEIQGLREDLKERFGDYEIELEELKARVGKVENFNWRLLSICLGAVFLLEVSLRVMEIFFKK